MQPELIVERLQQLKNALGRRDRAAINAIVFELTSVAAPLGGQWLALARLMLENGELTAAQSAVQLLIAQTGDTPESRFHQASILAQCGQIKPAWEIMAALPDDVPDPLGSAYLRGTMAINLGDVALARKHLVRALDHNPLSGQSWMALVTALGKGIDDTTFNRLADVEPRISQCPAIEQANYFYALGSACHARGEIERAVAAFARGAAARRTSEPYDAAADQRPADAAVSGWDSARVSDLNKQVTVDTSRSILVTGLPRSGTTLVEQILTSHSAVVGGEELSRFRLVLQDLGGPEADAVDRWRANGGPIDSLAQLYLHLVEERFGSTGRVVDKTLEASRYLGLAAAILPDAPIVWMRRDPMDCAWSIFRTYFVRGLRWTWDFADIANHMMIEDRLLDYWRAVLGKRLLVLHYEDLVTEPAHWIGRLLDHCGLEPEPGVFEPHKSERTVVTASVLQVREPINRRGIGVSGPYLPYMQPFIERYRVP